MTYQLSSTDIKMASPGYYGFDVESTPLRDIKNPSLESHRLPPPSRQPSPGYPPRYSNITYDESDGALLPSRDDKSAQLKIYHEDLVRLA
jgi:hypothetical protein